MTTLTILDIVYAQLNHSCTHLKHFAAPRSEKPMPHIAIRITTEKNIRLSTYNLCIRVWQIPAQTPYLKGLRQAAPKERKAKTKNKKAPIPQVNNRAISSVLPQQELSKQLLYQLTILSSQHYFMSNTAGYKSSPSKVSL